MDEFVYVIIGGLLFILIMMIWVVPPSGDQNVTDITLINQSFSVGYFPDLIPRYIRFGDFKVSYSSGSEVLETAKNIEITKGVFENNYYSMGVEIEENMDFVTEGFIDIYISDTNSEGDLVVKVNDEIVSSQTVGNGKIDVSIPKTKLKEYNTIELSCLGTGWKFWKKTVYKIDKMEVGINVYGKQQKVVNFEVYKNELDDFESAELDFEVDEYKGAGDLVIEINDHTLFAGNPIGKFPKSFDDYDVGLSKGMNSITFSAEKGSEFEIEDAELIIYHEEPGRKIREFGFYVSSSQYSKMDEGSVKFYIADSNYLGSLLLTIEDCDGAKHPTEAIQSYSVGKTKTIEFDKDYVCVGNNKVIFEASGDGNFILSDVEIRIV